MGKRNNETIKSVTPTICKLFSIDFPNVCNEPPLNEIINIASKKQETAVEKGIVFCADAMGSQLLNFDSRFFDKINKYSPVRITLRSIFPTVTPVCFASMFTGTDPDIHGINKFEKPVLNCETLFDSFVKANKRIAIVAVEGSSIDKIFRNRKIDHFSEKYDQEVQKKTLELIQGGSHDFIVSYNQEYDDMLHSHGPFHNNSIKSAKNVICRFIEIGEITEKFWKKYNRMISFSPDHGGHFDEKTGKGGHVTDSEEDMVVSHFFGIFNKI